MASGKTGFELLNSPFEELFPSNRLSIQLLRRQIRSELK